MSLGAPLGLAAHPGWRQVLTANLADAEGMLSNEVGTIHADRRPRGGRQAAVMILVADADRPDITFVERAATMRTHPGQIAFPGGGVDPGDADAAAAALRETHEEVGLNPAAVDVLGCLPTAHVAASGFDVVSVVGTWSGREPIGVADPREVAAVHRFAIDALADPAHRVTARHFSGYRGPAFIVDSDADPEPIMIWGFTAHLLDRFLMLGGWERPWDAGRLAEIPRRFLRD